MRLGGRLDVQNNQRVKHGPKGLTGQTARLEVRFRGCVPSECRNRHL